MFKRSITLLTLLVTSYIFGNEFEIEHASVSLYAIDMRTGEVLLDKNSDLSMTPASCMKVITTAAALELLGPEAHFDTELQYSGFIDQENTLQGNLYIRGGGDPCLGSDRIGSWEQQLDCWVDEVRKLGIDKIGGRVIGDATRWEKALAVPSWTWADLGNYYGAGASALSFHENYYSLAFKPGTLIGEETDILSIDPPVTNLKIHNTVKTGPIGSGDCTYLFGSEFSYLQFARGTVPAGVAVFSIRGTVPDPAAFCADLFSQKLQEKGISVLNQEYNPQTKRTPFHTTHSPPIEKIIYWTNQKSINLYAEHLLKRMGEVVFNKASTKSGIQAVTNFWRSQKIDLSGFNMADGSGLSRKNYVTAKQLVAILLKMRESSHFSLFFESLPLKEEGIRAKSGTMSGVKGLAGYSGDIAFAILINHCQDKQDLNTLIDNTLSYIKNAHH